MYDDVYCLMMRHYVLCVIMCDGMVWCVMCYATMMCDV